MFCPVCKAEYRFGFTHCNDCDVDLVEALPSSPERVGADFSADREDLDAPELLWSGIDSGAFTRIRSALDEARIPYNDEPVEARLLYASMRNPLEVWVQRADRDAARKILSNLFGGVTDQTAEPVVDGMPPEGTGLSDTIGFGHRETKLPRPDIETHEPKEADESPQEVPEGDLDEFDPDEAAVEAWSGTDREIARMVKDSLRENGIGCVISSAGDGMCRVLVSPITSRRAHEIVREIVEGVPPE